MLDWLYDELIATIYSIMVGIQAYYTSRKEEIMAAKRRETPVVGDMQPLQMALPTLEEIVRQSQKNSSKSVLRFFVYKLKYLCNLNLTYTIKL